MIRVVPLPAFWGVRGLSLNSGRAGQVVAFPPLPGVSYALSMDLMGPRERPERSAISRSWSSMAERAGSSPSRPPRMSLGTLRFEVWVPSS